MKKKDLEEKNKILEKRVRELETKLKVKAECLDHLETAFGLCKVIKEKEIHSFSAVFSAVFFSFRIFPQRFIRLKH